LGRSHFNQLKLRRHTSANLTSIEKSQAKKKAPEGALEAYSFITTY
jgi:hypothetical protein